MKTPLHDIFEEHRIGLSSEIGLNTLLDKASLEELSPASNDSEKILFLAIDMQNDFMEKGQLAVLAHTKIYTIQYAFCTHIWRKSHELPFPSIPISPIKSFTPSGGWTQRGIILPPLRSLHQKTY